jgi:hypothetical protein
MLQTISLLIPPLSQKLHIKPLLNRLINLMLIDLYRSTSIRQIYYPQLPALLSRQSPLTDLSYLCHLLGQNSVQSTHIQSTGYLCFLFDGIWAENGGELFWQCGWIVQETQIVVFYYRGYHPNKYLLIPLKNNHRIDRNSQILPPQAVHPPTHYPSINQLISNSQQPW